MDENIKKYHHLNHITAPNDDMAEVTASSTRNCTSQRLQKLLITTSFLLLCSINHVSSFSIRSATTPIISRSLDTSSDLGPLAMSDSSNDNNSKKTNVIAGASGYIGKSTVRESVRQGYNTIALVRDKTKITSSEGKAMYGQFFEGATVVECDVCNPEALTQVRTCLCPIIVFQP